MDAHNLIPPPSPNPPSPNIIDGKNDYTYHDVNYEYTPRSSSEVIQAPSSDPKAVREDEGEGEDEDRDESEFWVVFFEKNSFEFS